MQISDVRITVLKKLQTDEVFKQYAVDGMTPTCNLLKDGAEFVSRRICRCRRGSAAGPGPTSRGT